MLKGQACNLVLHMSVADFKLGMPGKAHVDALLQERGSASLQETSYPSNSLNFLSRSNPTNHAQPNPQEPKLQNLNLPQVTAKVKLNILIAGAGLGGLSTAIALRRHGHTVTILERAASLEEVGAGIQIPPNSSRLLLKYGLGSYISSKVTEPEAIRMRRWQDGAVLSTTQLRPGFREKYGAPYYVVHRANLQLALRDLAVDLGVALRLGAGVREYGKGEGKVVLESGEECEADFVIAADGVKSEARRVVLGGVDQAPQKAGFAAYRAVVDVELMKRDPELEWLLESPGQNLWVGDNRHVMTYTIAGGKTLNMVLSHPDDSDPSVWRQDTVIEDMKKQFENWDPRLVKLISLIRTTLKWPLLSGKPLEKWVSPGSKLVIIGDAAHAMVPYMSEGAAMAVEDGAALAEVLSFMTLPSQLPDALKTFERVRVLRTGQMQEASLVNGKLWHFADGPEQRARDAAMKTEGDGESPNQWSDVLTASWTYGYDAEKEVRKAWIESIGTVARL
ncbi:FAD/NAD(P)-binding domain-containing protein [Byssothecium circinans]|uniref:FAD/NAD(P)-binding domain-containing protein n=1 Tax=Byssothecium circinans TaxID=147558 RepID=A0A6A5U2A1_9PLEO|nr:FAD/NAD(P)-binding domain-containing protein [Byssothecium circinans]